MDDMRLELRAAAWRAERAKALVALRRRLPLQDFQLSSSWGREAELQQKLRLRRKAR